MTTPIPPASPCSRCAAALGTSCCEVAPHEQLATLTRADIERVREATGRRPAEFVAEEWLSDPEAHAYEARRPLYAGYFRQGPRRLTLQRRHGACVFFVPGRGCALGDAMRPTACLLYPFELWPGGEWSVSVGRFGDLAQARANRGESCLGVEEAGGMEELLAAFGTTRAAVEALGARLRAEVRDHARPRGRRSRRDVVE